MGEHLPQLLMTSFDFAVSRIYDGLHQFYL